MRLRMPSPVVYPHLGSVRYLPLRQSSCRADLDIPPASLGSRLMGALALAGALALLVAPSARAHVLNEGGPTGWNIALAVAGVAAIGAGIALSARRRRRPGLGLFVVGIIAMTVAGSGPIFPPGPRSSPVQIRIVEPQWGAKVTSPVTVKVELTDGILVPMDRTSGPPTEGHLHLYANGRAVGMFDKAEETLELPPGKYVLQAEFTGADHRSFEPFVADTVEFEVVAATG